MNFKSPTDSRFTSAWNTFMFAVDFGKLKLDPEAIAMVKASCKLAENHEDELEKIWESLKK